MFLTICCNSYGQTIISKTFYKDYYRSEELKDSKKAKFVEIKTEIDESTLSYEFVRIKDDKLFEYRCYKNNIPYGLWKNYNKRSNSFSELDYTFEVNYSKEKFTNNAYFEFGTEKIELNSESNANLISPKIIGSENSVLTLYKTIRYPAFARKNGISGEVKVHVKISVEGKLSIVAIYEGYESHLDAESIRALNQCQNWEPATLNGEAIESYSIVPIKYRLE